MQMNVRVKPLINDHLLKTTSVQRPHSNYVPKMTDDCGRFHEYLVTETTSVQRSFFNKDFYLLIFKILTCELAF